MATTPNLRLNLFNGNDRPNYLLFNENNEIIDNILVKAKTHNHDGLNSSKISATNVVFNNMDTTLKANNLEDAVKEVFQEADSKIQWITDTIGTTKSGVSNPDIRVDEIKADFEAARETYLAKMKEATLFKVQGTLPGPTASIREINDAINNTTFKEATATSDDMVVGARAIDKFGVPVDGTLQSRQQTVIKPDPNSDVVFEKGVYPNFSFLGFGLPNPEMYIRRGKSILGINGALMEHGSNGWDVGESISKNKLTSIHKDSCYLKEINHTNIFGGHDDKRVSFCSAKYPINISVDGKSIMAQHFKINNKGEIIAYTSDFRDHVIKRLDTFSSSTGKVPSRNIYTNLYNLKVIQYAHSAFLVALCSNYIKIVNLATFKVVYDKNPHIGAFYCMVAKLQSQELAPKIIVVGKLNSNYFSSVLYPEDENDADSLWKAKYQTLGPDIYYVVNPTTKESIEVIPKYTVVSDLVKTTDCRIDSGLIYLNLGDKIRINKYLNKYDGFELVYSIPVGGPATNIKVTYEDSNGNVATENISVSNSGTSSKILIPTYKDTVTIECTKGIARIHAVKIPQVGAEENADKLFSQEWGFLGHNLVPMNQVSLEGTEDECLLWAGSITNLDDGYSSAMIALSRINLNEDLLETIPKSYSSLKIEDMYLGTYTDVDLDHKCLSFISEYDNYLYGTFPNKEVSNVAVTGTRHYKYNRRLIKLRYSLDKLTKAININIIEDTKSLEHRLFKPMFINHLGQLIGLEQGCTPQKFTYLTKLNHQLKGGLIESSWSEEYYRTAEEEMQILDDGNSINTLKMLTGVIRCFDEDGSLSNTKLLGNVYYSSSSNYRKSTADMGTSVDESKVFKNGFISMFNTVYKINSLKE